MDAKVEWWGRAPADPAIHGALPRRRGSAPQHSPCLPLTPLRFRESFFFCSGDLFRYHLGQAEFVAG